MVVYLVCWIIVAIVLPLITSLFGFVWFGDFGVTCLLLFGVLIVVYCCFWDFCLDNSVSCFYYF